MIKKFKNKLRKLKVRYGKVFTTTFYKSLKQSDINRWKKDKSLFLSWNERTQLLANQIIPDSKVFEFGAARMALKTMLPSGCIYLHSDIVKRNKNTLVIDLNAELPNISKVDYIVFSGVLEYIFDVKRLLLHLAQFSEHFIFSYALTDAFPEISNRRYNGWVSDLNTSHFLEIANELGWNYKIIGTWKKQTLFKFSK